MAVPVTQPLAERHFLSAKHGGDALKATVTLLGDNVIQAEVAVKHAKSAGGMFRAVAQPDVQWKLQQLQVLHSRRQPEKLSCYIRTNACIVVTFRKKVNSGVSLSRYPSCY
ncbi:hypothetical protein ANCCAN_29689 [Ancylostoma caninum]|uniref:Uncharacterized protein n=1 Tax=Ancylostoma caninum TaxID=29170 RepID=A0A368EXW6_ANCCA|nr:hypothetical protein ANCCAN_29689 [Ancylostoma caninum]